jgi:hypothetical protein
MTKKHFEAIARIVDFRRSMDAPTDGAFFNLVSDLADYFKSENPRFDRARFLEACGYGGMP